MLSVLSASARWSGLLAVVILLSGLSADAAVPAHKASARPASKTGSKAPIRTGVKPGVKAGVKPAARPVAQAPAKPVAVVDPNEFIKYYNTGKAAYNSNNYTTAEPAIKKSLQLAEKVNGPQHKNVAIIAHLAGMNALQLEKYSEAESFLKRSLAIHNLPANQASSQQDIARENLVLGQLAMYLGHYQQAEAYYRTGIPLAEKTLGPDDAHTVEARQILADIVKIDYGADYLADVGSKLVHWNDPLNQPIRVYVADGSSVPGWKPEDRALVQNAYAEWQQALDNQVRFEFTDNPQDADTRVSWMEKPKPADPKDDPAAPKELRSGECQHETLGDMLIRDDIVIAVNSETGKPYTYNSMHNVALHEIGHSLGLIGGHSRNPSDILFPNSRYEGGLRKKLSQRDINTVKHLYSLKPEVSNPSGIHLTRYHDFTEERRAGFEAINAKDNALALARLKNAMAIYDQDLDVRFFTGQAAYGLKQYDEAVPYFLVVSAQPGKFQADALKMTGYAVIKSAELDDRSGNRQKAEQKYAYAQRLLFGKVNSMPMEAETNKAIRDQLNWLNQRLALRSAPVIQWASDSPTQTASNPEAVKPKKKKKWLRFFDPIPAAGEQIVVPGSVLGY